MNCVVCNQDISHRPRGSLTCAGECWRIKRRARGRAWIKTWSAEKRARKQQQENKWERRNYISKPLVEHQCVQCASKFYGIARRDLKFCSKACARSAYWRRRYVIEPQTCSVCGVKHYHRKRWRYCSTDCMTAFYKTLDREPFYRAEKQARSHDRRRQLRSDATANFHMLRAMGLIIAPHRMGKYQLRKWKIELLRATKEVLKQEAAI